MAQIEKMGAISIEFYDEKRWWPEMLDTGLCDRVKVVRIFPEPEMASLDISPLRQCSNLEVLSIVGGDVNDISPLADLRKLKDIILGSSRVVDLSPLARLENLETLQVFFPRVSDISPLAGLKRLRQLSLTKAKIQDISPLAQLPNLEHVDLCYNQIIDISPLGRLKKLRYLYVFGTKVSERDVTMLQRQLPNCRIINKEAGE